MRLAHKPGSGGARLNQPRIASGIHQWLKIILKPLWKDPLTYKWHRPEPVLIWGKGHAWIFDNQANNARWLPKCLLKLIIHPGEAPEKPSNSA